MPRASQLYKYLCKVVLLIALLLQSGCATVTSKSLTTTANISELTTFQVNGRLAVIQPTKKQSAYFYWQQNNEDYKLTVNTFLGINVFTAKRDKQGITITTSEKSYTNSAPQVLLFELTGWWLPLDELNSWFKADLNPSQGDITMYESSYATGKVKTFTPFCPQFSCPQSVSITYKDYRNVGQLTLPFSITVDVDGDIKQRIRIKIKEWL